MRWRSVCVESMAVKMQVVPSTFEAFDWLYSIKYLSQGTASLGRGRSSRTLNTEGPGIIKAVRLQAAFNERRQSELMRSPQHAPRSNSSNMVKS
jgi:hypothetical protein